MWCRRPRRRSSPSGPCGYDESTSAGGFTWTALNVRQWGACGCRCESRFCDKLRCSLGHHGQRRTIMGMSEFDPAAADRRAWNAGRKFGAKRPLKPRQVWAIRFYLDQHRRMCGLASKAGPRPFLPQVIGTKQLSQIDWGSVRRRFRPPLPLLTRLLSILA